ncbi:MAG: 4Fe-4S binding protein [Deltaproteobacteria bacterium]
MSEEYITPRYRISIDDDACGNAVLCQKCVHTCLEHGANCLGFVNKDSPSLDNLPKRLEDIDHRILATFMFNCDGCNKCVEVCPKGALSLIVPEQQIPRAVIQQDGAVVLCSTQADGTINLPPERDS